MDLLNKEAALVGGAEKVVLGGFSQGAAMTMYVGLQYPQRLAGLVALSGYLPFYDKFEAEVSDALCRFGKYAHGLESRN